MRGRGKGKGKYMGRSQPQPGACSGRKTLRTCRNKKEKDNVVVIDVDGDNFRNVILIDIPESLPKKIQGPDSRVPRKDKRFPLRTVIYIDDDENTEEDCIGTGTNGKENFAGASSSMRCTTSYQDSVDPVGDECQFVQENISPVKLSKCKRTYSGKVYTTNRYGLTSGIESDSSDDDFDDEFMESSFEQWQKAAMKRKNGHQDIGGGNETYKSQKETLFEDLPEHREKSSMKTKNNVCKEDHASTSKIFYDDIRQETERKSKASSSSLGKGYQFDHQEQCSPQNTPSGPILEEQSNEHVNQADVFFKDKQENPHRGPVLSSSEPNEEASFRNTQPYHELVGEIPKEFLFCKSSLGKSEVEGEKDLHQEQEEPSLCKVSANESQVKQVSSLDNGEDSADKHLHAQEGIDNSLINEREKLKQTDEYKRAVEEEWASRQKELQIQAEEAQHLRRMRKRREGDETTDCVENSLINKREKLKETDEYKRAAEEEWASRQRELQIQAEEAQHLRRMRKRRKAETMRLLDMEKRQKQRVEEIRETQKKDEENMNLKEELRAEVRKELQKLEVTCTDLASLLRGLGIVVNGGLNPQSQEVRVAYKKALLNFHPDRASQSDVRQQVEAEEKFKLISRMKDKFLPTL